MSPLLQSAIFAVLDSDFQSEAEACLIRSASLHREAIRFEMADDEVAATGSSGVIDVTEYLYPAVRLGSALAVVWYSSTSYKYVSVKRGDLLCQS